MYSPAKRLRHLWIQVFQCQVHEEVVVRIDKSKEDHAEAPFIVIKETAGIAERLYLYVL